MIRVERKGAMQTPMLAVPPRTVSDNAAVLVSDQHRTSHAALLAALVIGALVRGWHVWEVDFPLNDGGLFYAMVRDIERAHYHLPAFTSYNGAHIPFGYSPLGFYLAGVLNDRGVDLLTLFRILPFAASTACILAFYLLAREMLQSRAALSAAVIAFAIVPRGFVWLLMGGGLTPRSATCSRCWRCTRSGFSIRAARCGTYHSLRSFPRSRCSAIGTAPSWPSAPCSSCSFAAGIARGCSARFSLAPARSC